MYRTNFGIGHSMKDLLEAHIPPRGRLGRGHKGLFGTINNSIDFRPINLVGNLYKWLAKVLANKLKKVVGKVI